MDDFIKTDFDLIEELQNIRYFYFIKSF